MLSLFILLFLIILQMGEVEVWGKDALRGVEGNYRVSKVRWFICLLSGHLH